MHPGRWPVTRRTVTLTAMTSMPDMNARTAPWRALLEEAGAQLRDDRVSSVPAPGEGARMVPLLDRAWLSFRGPDARAFLHDQLAAPVSDIPDSAMRLAAYCGPKGRTLAVFRVTGESRDELRAELPAALAEGIARRLAMFVLRTDVRVEFVEDMTALGCWGEEAPGLLSSLELPVPDEPFAAGRRRETSVTRLPGPVPRFQLTGPAGPVTDAWRHWLGAASPAGSADWQYLDVRAGLPELGPETTDQHLPQSLGLEQWQAVSYRKGCYPGQEVIARAHYRGRLKRHLYRAVTRGTPPGPGTDVVDGDGKRVGSIISSAPHPAGGGVLLAVLHERAGPGCRTADDEGQQLHDPEPVEA